MHVKKLTDFARLCMVLRYLKNCLISCGLVGKYTEPYNHVHGVHPLLCCDDLLSGIGGNFDG